MNANDTHTHPENADKSIIFNNAASAPSTSAPTDSTEEMVTDDDADEGIEEYNDEEHEEANDTDEIVEENSGKQIDDNTLVLISVRQLNRIFGTDRDDEFEIEDGFLLKYHGQSGDIVIPKSVVVICNHAFEGCAGLTSVTIPASVKLIGQDAFRNCANLVEIDMPFYLLKSVAPCVGFFFSGTPIAEFLRKDSEFWKRYAAEMKAAEQDAADEEEDNESEENESRNERDNNDDAKGGKE